MEASGISAFLSYYLYPRKTNCDNPWSLVRRSRLISVDPKLKLSKFSYRNSWRSMWAGRIEIRGAECGSRELGETVVKIGRRGWIVLWCEPGVKCESDWSLVRRVEGGGGGSSGHSRNGTLLCQISKMLPAYLYHKPSSPLNLRNDPKT